MCFLELIAIQVFRNELARVLSLLPHAQLVALFKPTNYLSTLFVHDDAPSFASVDWDNPMLARKDLNKVSDL
jgi:hypothetical protein